MIKVNLTLVLISWNSVISSFMIQGAVSQEEIIMKVKAGSDVTLPCQISDSDITKQPVNWFKEHEWLSSGRAILVYKKRLRINKPYQNEWNLVIKNIDTAFKGLYKCEVNGQPPKLIIRVIVETKPNINEKLSSESSISVAEGTTITIKCVVNGEPIPDIKWYREIPGHSQKDFTEVTGRNITLPDASRYSDGLYTCEASNIHGKSRRSFKVKVNFPPEVTVLAPTITVSKSSRVVMMCAIHGQPLFRTYWKDNHGEPIKNNYKFTVHEENQPEYHARFLTLVLHQATWSAADFGTYRCYADGDGSSSSAIVILREATNDSP